MAFAAREALSGGKLISEKFNHGNGAKILA
jgi:hypothetical protein